METCTRKVGAWRCFRMPALDRKMCDVCLDLNRRSSKRCFDAQKAAGRCTRRGCKRKPKAGRSMCARHCALHVAASKRHEAKFKMTLDEAKELISSGELFHAIHRQVDESERDALKQWYTATAGVPNLCARGPILNNAERTRSTYIHHTPCTKCGSEEFVPGACPTCANCGESSGGCG